MRLSIVCVSTLSSLSSSHPSFLLWTLLLSSVPFLHIPLVIPPILSSCFHSSHPRLPSSSLPPPPSPLPLPPSSLSPPPLSPPSSFSPPPPSPLLLPLPSSFFLSPPHPSPLSQTPHPMLECVPCPRQPDVYQRGDQNEGNGSDVLQTSPFLLLPPYLSLPLSLLLSFPPFVPSSGY